MSLPLRPDGEKSSRVDWGVHVVGEHPEASVAGPALARRVSVWEAGVGSDLAGGVECRVVSPWFRLLSPSSPLLRLHRRRRAR